MIWKNLWYLPERSSTRSSGRLLRLTLLKVDMLFLFKIRLTKVFELKPLGISVIEFLLKFKNCRFFVLLRASALTFFIAFFDKSRLTSDGNSFGNSWNPLLDRFKNLSSVLSRKVCILSLDEIDLMKFPDKSNTWSLERFANALLFTCDMWLWSRYRCVISKFFANTLSDSVVILLPDRRA